MNSPASGNKDFFISYNQADLEWAEWIGWQLEEAGFSVEVQKWDFRAGDNFVAKMAIASARLIAVLSPDYLKSTYTFAEWSSTFERDPLGESRLLIPVRVRECQPGGLLANRIYVDLVGVDEESARQKLLSELTQERTRFKPDRPPRFPGRPASPKFPGASTPREVRRSGSNRMATWIRWLQSVEWNTVFGGLFLAAFFAVVLESGWSLLPSASRDTPRSRRDPPADPWRKTFSRETRTIDVSGRDAMARQVKYRIWALAQDYSWKRGSASTVIRPDGEPVPLEKALAESGIAGLASRGVSDLIAVGMSSCVGSSDEEDQRAQDRARSIGTWLRTVAATTPSIESIQSLNLGQQQVIAQVLKLGSSGISA